MGTGLRGEPGASVVRLVKEGLKIVLGPAPILQRPMEENHAQVQLKRHGTVTSK